MQIFEEKQCSLVMHDAVVVNENHTEEIMPSFFGYRGSKTGAFANLVKNSYMGCCMAFKSELKEWILPIPDEIQMHDQWIGILNDKCYKDSYFLREPLLLYRRHGDNNSGMKHYGVFRMIRNRVVFCWRFLQRILKHS